MSTFTHVEIILSTCDQCGKECMSQYGPRIARFEKRHECTEDVAA